MGGSYINGLAVIAALLSVARKSFVFNATEEHLSAELPRNEPFWQIDPIDGTKPNDPKFREFVASQFEHEIDGRRFRVACQSSNYGLVRMAGLQ